MFNLSFRLRPSVASCLAHLLPTLAAVIATACALAPSAAHAHVKWFADFDYATPPRAVTEALTPTFWAMLVLSIVVLVVLVRLDAVVGAWPPALRLNHWFDERAQYSLLVMRVATFATLLVAWQIGTLFAPELKTNNAWIERLQFLVVLLLLTERTTSLAGLGLFAIWAYGASKYGLFHMLDYVNVLGVAYFLAFRPLTTPTLRATTLPVLYATVGFSLMWLACEKLVYPAWINYLLEQNPILTLGLDKDFFRVAAAFIELGLGFLLIIGLFGRSLSIIITLTFFLTTCIFGKVEIIGHTLIHAALIVFLLEGPGHTFKPPAYFHKTLGLRTAFATVNFTILTFVVLFAYNAVARKENERYLAAPSDATTDHHATLALAESDPVPTLALEATPDPAGGGWNLHLVTTNFRFAPDHVGQPPTSGEGHALLQINGADAGYITGEWHHLRPVSPTSRDKLVIRIALASNDHRALTKDGKKIEVAKSLERN